MELLKLGYIVKQADYSHAGDASSRVKKKLKLLGLQPSVIKRIVISIYEAEVNMIAHAFGGNIEVSIDEEKVMAIMQDKGPGIPDVKKAMKKGFTTASEEVRQMGFGAGMGLPNIEKNADELVIDTIMGQGTKLTIVFYYSGQNTRRDESI